MSIFESSLPTEILELSSYAPTRSTIKPTPLDTGQLRKSETCWLARNYVSLRVAFLQGNPLLADLLRQEHIKNRLLKKYDLDAIFFSGPGHGAPGVVGPTCLEGIYS